MVSFDQTPDTPPAFGYKVAWFAVKASDAASVLEALELDEAMPANWASGIEAAYGHSAWKESGPWVFVSPPVNGWILAVSASWPYPVDIERNRDIGQKFDVLFHRLMMRFDEVQFFGSHRVADFVAEPRADPDIQLLRRRRWSLGEFRRADRRRGAIASCRSQRPVAGRRGRQNVRARGAARSRRVPAEKKRSV